MLIYFTPILIAAIHYALKLMGKESYVTIKRYKIEISAILMSITMLLTIGLRSVNVGSDTVQYRTHIISQYGPLSLNEIFGPSDPLILHKLVCALFYRLNIPFYAYTFTIALFCMLCLFCFVIKHVKDPVLGILTFVFLGYYSLCFTALKQMIAISFILLYFSIRKKDKWDTFKFVICFSCACGFHLPAVILLPSFFLSKLSYSKKTVSCLVILSCISFIFRNILLKLLLSIAFYIEPFYSNVYEYVYSVHHFYGLKLYILLLVVVMAYIFFCDTEFKAQNSEWLYLILWGIILFPFTVSGGAIMRIVYYYMVFCVAMIPNILCGINDRNKRITAKGCVISLGTLYYLTLLINNVGEIVPYSFFWE